MRAFQVRRGAWAGCRLGRPPTSCRSVQLLHELRHARVALIGIERHRFGEHHIHGLDQRVTRSHRRVLAVKDGPKRSVPARRPGTDGARRPSRRRTTARLKMSDRSSTSRPESCSGDMYSRVPSTWPNFVSVSLRVSRSGAPSVRAMPKSTSFTDPVSTQHDVAGLHITMQHAAAVRVRQSATPRLPRCAAPLRSVSGLHAGARQATRPSSSGITMKRSAVLFADIIESADVRVIELAYDPALHVQSACENQGPPRPTARAPSGRESLRGTPRVAAAIHLSHATRPDGGHDLIRPEARARLESHIFLGSANYRQKVPDRR